MELPELRTATLDDATFTALIADLQAHAEVLEVTVKGAAGRMSDGKPVPLGAAIEALRAGGARGVQIRYRWGGSEWRDTLIAQGGEIRLVRMEVAGEP